LEFTTNDQPIARYTHEWLTKLILVYLYYVVPFREIIEPVSFASNPYLFSVPRTLNHWTVNQQTSALQKHSKIFMQFNMTTQKWRQIQTALDVYFVHSGIDNSVEEDELDVIEDLQAAHSTRMSKTHYGRTEVGLDVRSRRDFRNNSGFWHVYFKFRSRRPESDYAEAEVVEKPPEGIDSQIDSAMTRIHGSDWHWKHPQQGESVHAMVEGTPHLVSILPTGAGKTTLPLVQSVLAEDKTQVVITPYVALSDQLRDQCQELGLSCIIWKPGCRQRANIVVVVVDTATSAEFRYYVDQISARSKLGSIFIDELHVYYTEATWRQKISLLLDLTLPVQFIFMSATHPPSMESHFNTLFSLTNLNPVVIRGQCVRPNIQYSVRKIPQESGLINSAVQLIESEIELTRRSEQKILVFAPQIQQLRDIQNQLGKTLCGLYYAGEPDKEQTLKAWREGSFPVLCATTALGAGMDVRKVGLVVHVDFIYDIFAFTQGSGRAGRDGERARSITLLTEQWFNRKSARLTPAGRALEDYCREETCRQTALSRYFNGPSTVMVNCLSLNANLCDLCERHLNETEVGNDSSTVTSSINSTHSTPFRPVSLKRKHIEEASSQREGRVAEKLQTVFMHSITRP
jgi:superfamily II DNA helicase RecQ